MYHWLITKISHLYEMGPHLYEMGRPMRKGLLHRYSNSKGQEQPAQPLSCQALSVTELTDTVHWTSPIQQHKVYRFQ